MRGLHYDRPYTQRDAQRIAAWAEVARLRNAFQDARECQVCGSQRTLRDRPLSGHHWRGYDHPSDVWWVCESCHIRMRSQHIGHDGTLPLAEVRYILGYADAGQGESETRMRAIDGVV